MRRNAHHGFIALLSVLLISSILISASIALTMRSALEDENEVDIRHALQERINATDYSRIQALHLSP